MPIGATAQPFMKGSEGGRAGDAVRRSQHEIPTAFVLHAEQRGKLSWRRRWVARRAHSDTLTWWTFAGGRINQTLKYAIEHAGRWKVVPDNFTLKVEGDGLGFEPMERVVDTLRAPGFWDDPELRRALFAKVPEYRLSKFQRVLPERWHVEMVGGICWTSEARGRP